MSYGVALVSDLTIVNICEIMWMSGWLFLAYMFINKISQWLANIFYRTLGDERTRHVFFMNKGDVNIQKKIENETKRNKLLIAGSVIGTFMLNLVCTIICELIVR